MKLKLHLTRCITYLVLQISWLLLINRIRKRKKIFLSGSFHKLLNSEYAFLIKTHADFFFPSGIRPKTLYPAVLGQLVMLVTTNYNWRRLDFLKPIYFTRKAKMRVEQENTPSWMVFQRRRRKKISVRLSPRYAFNVVVSAARNFKDSISLFGSYLKIRS